MAKRKWKAPRNYADILKYRDKRGSKISKERMDKAISNEQKNR